MKVLVVIPARGGSRRLPGKNLREVAGMSLLARAVWTARQFRWQAVPTADIVVDTDDPAIAAEALAWGAEVPGLRPPHLAADDATTADTVLGLLGRLAIQGRRYEAIVLVQPTSPLRSAEHLTRCWRRFVDGAEAVVAVTTAGPAPRHLIRLAPGDRVLGPPVAAAGADGTPWRLSGSAYVIRPDSLARTRSFVPASAFGVPVPELEAVDVDTAADLTMADALARSAPVAGFAVAGRMIGAGGRCFVIAEAGVNHNGDLALARRLVDVAHDAGADAVKFQTFEPNMLVAPGAPKATYQESTSAAGESQDEMLRRLALSRGDFAHLASHAASRGILFLSTPFDQASAEFLVDLGVPALKVPSGELTNLPLLRTLGGLGRPILLSTGMATLAEVADAIEAAEQGGAPTIATLHCVSSYPAPPESSNLAAMATLRAAFGRPAGWSDHTLGTDVAVAAIASGADLLEKHLTLDRRMDGPDHAASLEPGEFAGLLRAIRHAEAARGSGRKIPVAAERDVARVARRSLHVRRALPAGHVLAAEDLIALRPGTGLSPARLSVVVGRRLRDAVAALTLLTEDRFA